MVVKPRATTLQPETVRILEKIQKLNEMNPTFPQMIHAAVEKYGKGLGIEA